MAGALTDTRTVKYLIQAKRVTVPDFRLPPPYISSFLWDVTQRRLVVAYRRFGTTYQLLLDCLALEDAVDGLYINVDNKLPIDVA
jgi:hypothetical protein